MPDFWQAPTAQATRPRPRLLAENGRTGLERGPQPHIIASPPGTGAPIDRINYTPDTGEVHPPGVLAPINKLNYSLVPHDDLNYSGQLGQPSAPAPGTNPPGLQAQGGGDAGSGMSGAMQSQQAPGPIPSNVWKNTGDPGMMGTGADSIVNSPGTPAGTDGLMGRYGEGATLRSNTFSPGQPPLSPNPYGTGPGPRSSASGPVERPFDQRASNTGNLGNWGQNMGGMGMGADDDGDGYDDNTGEPVDDSPESSIYGGNGGGGSQGGTQPSGSSSTVNPQTSGSVGAEGAPTSSPPGYHMELKPANPRGPDGKLVRQDIWQISDDPSRPSFPVGWYDSQVKAGSTERPYHPFTLQQQRTMSPDYAKELDAAAKGQSTAGNHITEIIGKDGNKHRVMVDKDGALVNDMGVSEVAKPVAGQGDRKVVGGASLSPHVMVKGPDGNWGEDEAESAKLAKENADKASNKDQQSELDRQQRLDAAQSKPYTVYNDQSGQSWLVNTQTGEKEQLGTVDPKAGIFESNGRLIKIGADGNPTEIFKPPPGYDLHYDSFGKAIAINKDDPSKTVTAYTPDDYEDQKATAKQKALLDIEKTKSDLATSKITQTDSRMKMMDALQKLEHPEARFMGTSDIYLPSGSAADVQRYNPETKTSTYEHVSGGDLSPEQKANAARMRSMLDELDKAMAGGDTNKANAIATEVQKTQQAPQDQTKQPTQQDEIGLLNLGPAGSSTVPGWPGRDVEHLSGSAQPPTNRTTAAGDIAQYDAQGNLTGIRYQNTAPPHYGEEGYPGSPGYDEGVGSTLQGGLEDNSQPDELDPSQAPEEDYQDPAAEDYWSARRQRYMGTGTDIPQGGQGLPDQHKPAGRPGYPTEPSQMPSPMASPAPPGGMPPGAPQPGGQPGGQDPAAIAAHPDYNPLNPPDLAALGPPGGGGGSAGATPVGMPPVNNMPPGGAQGAPPNLDDPLFKFAMQRRQGGGQMGGGQDEGQPQPAGQPGGYSGWTPPVPQDDVAGIGHRFGQQMNQGEPFHSGVDLQAVEGTPTIAPVDGVVQRVEYNPQGLGVTVVLQGKDGTTHKLGHLSETSAYPGLVVSQGQDLQSKVGSTGNTTGSHLHWAVKTPDGQPTDPTASLGAMASMPPVPGTQMMGPPGGSAAPGGSPGGRGSLSPVAAPSGALAVPSQAAPTQPAQPPPGGQPQPPVPTGAGADVSPNLGNADLPDEPEDHPLSPFSHTNKNPYGFNDRNLMLLWNQQHKRWVDAQAAKGSRPPSLVDSPPDPDWASKLRAEQEAKRQARRSAAADPWAPTGKASEVPQTGEPPDEEETWWQDPEDKPRVYEPGQGMAGRGTNTGRAPGAEVGGRYQRSEELRGQTAAEQRGRSRQSSDLPGSKNSPYREGITNPYDPNSAEGKAWQRQNDWFRRKQQPQIMVKEQLDKLKEQGWPQEAIDEMKALGHRPTKAEVEDIRARYKNTPTSPEPTEPSKTPGVLDQMSAGGKRLRAAAQARGPLDPNAPDYVPPDTYPAGGVLDRMGPGAKRLNNMTDEATEPEKPGWEPPASGMTPEQAQEIRDRVSKKWTEDYANLTPDDISQLQEARRVLGLPDQPEPGERVFGSPEEKEDWLHNQQSGYNDAVKSGDPLAWLKKQGYSQEDLDASNPYTQWTREDEDRPSQGNKMVTPPMDTGGGHKPPVGPSIEDLMKPNIFTPPVLGPGGHVPVPLPKMPGGHVPGPEIKLPNITDLPHPDIQLPGWLPGQSQGQPQAQPEGGTPEDYADMLERLRQMSAQGAGADEGDDAQIAAVLGIPPEQITDEIRQWWASRPQPGPQDVPQPGSDGMGAGLQLGPVHLSTTMRNPVRMPSSRMSMGRRAGWTPRAGGIVRRPSMGTSAMGSSALVSL